MRKLKEAFSEIVFIVVLILVAQAIVVGVVLTHDDVKSFNDGFLDGACAVETYEGEEVWEDGFGRPCYPSFERR